MGAPSDEDDFEFPDWHRAYHAAVVKTVQAAENVISKRLERIAARSDHEVERRAILEALGTLGFLKIEAQKSQSSRNPIGTKQFPHCLTSTLRLHWRPLACTCAYQTALASCFERLGFC
jgi:hypothetical protein